jgi:hypothetical protein
MTIGRLVGGMRARGHQVRVIRPRQGNDDVGGEHELALGGFPLPGYPGLRFGLPAGRRLHGEWRRQRPDLVHVVTEGPLGWSALQEEMQGQVFVADAQRWMQQHALGTGEGVPPEPQEARQELRRLLNLMLIDRLKALETEALAQAQTGQDPEALQRYKSLQARRLELTGQS